MTAFVTSTVAAALFVVIVTAVIGALFALPTMWLINYTNGVTHAGHCDFFNAWAILVLSGLLFKSPVSRGSNG